MKSLTSNEKMELLLSYAGKIAQTKALDILLYEIATMARHLIGVDRTSVWLIDKDRQVLWTKVAHGIPTIEIPINSGIVGRTIETGEIIVSNDPYSLDFFNQDVDKSTGYHTKSLLTIPLFNDLGQVIGAFQCVNKLIDDQQFNEEDVRLLQLVSGYAEKALVTAMLAIEIEATQVEIIMLMAEIGESRSKETGNHVKRVALISHELARIYGIDAKECYLLEVASPMHDIGKVSIPDAVLNKPGKLTDEEFKLIQSHTTIGYNLLKGSQRPIIKTAATIAHEHHEKWNGRGYPRGIAGNEIHIFARITAIADVFDALASPRVYKEAWPLEKVYNFFKEESGNHFDPELTEVFLEHFDYFAEILVRYKDV